MNRSLSTRTLLVTCLLSAPLLAGAEGCGGTVAIGGDDPETDGGSGASGGPGKSGGSASGGTSGKNGSAGSASGGVAGVPCGPITCDPGLFCCNASCGVCTPPGAACDAVACVPCQRERQALIDFIESNRSCTSDIGCRAEIVGCDIADYGCTGAVYVNYDADSATFEALRKNFYACQGGGCANCQPSSVPPTCFFGRCTTGCENERLRVRDFVNGNKACKTTQDCQGIQAGCGVTDDGCTGTVYVNRSIDRARFDMHLEELARCVVGANSCVNCERASPPAVCTPTGCQRLSP